MEPLLSAVLVLVTCMLAIPVLVVAAECLMAARYPDAARRSGIRPGGNPRIVVVIPAHNEESGIGKTLSAIAPELSARDQVLVVADNCTDRTADVARRCGATVLEREDAERRGKGYALDFALQHLRQDPPDVVVFLDADCQLSNGAVKLLAEVAFARRTPVQACNEMRQPGLTPQAGRSIAGFAWLVRGRVRPIGLAAMGLPCQLYGTGMALPWPVLQGLSLASSNIVEDMKLTLDLIESGTMPLFCSDAVVVSDFASTDHAADAQRKRWEHGHLATILRFGIPAAARGIRQLSLRKTMLALDVCVPPLTLLIILLAAGSIASVLALPYADAAGYTTGAFAAAWIVLVASLATAWSRFGRGLMTLRTVAGIPAYVLSKLPLYLKFLTDRQKEWNRTDRK